MTDEEAEKISVSDLRAHAAVLVELGLMPSLERVLAVVADVRDKNKPKVEEARQRKSVQRRKA
jgi:hypothetical protein